MLLRYTALVGTLALAVLPAVAGQLPPPQAAAAAAREAAPATGVIRGTITAADTGNPIRGADIRVEGGTLPRFEPRWARTDAKGQFEVTGLASGRYILTASRVGYLTLGYGQRRSGESGRPVDVSADRPLENIDFVLPRGSVVVARVTDRFGDPLRGIAVRAYQYRFVGGARRLQGINSGSGVTDDRGEQRLYGLPPGEYVLAASPALGPGSPRSDAETYYPGTVNVAEAQPVQLEVGQEAFVTFAISSVRPARLRGIIIGSTGAPLLNPMASLQMVYLGSGSSRRLSLAPDGSFDEQHLPPGEYVIEVRSPEWAVQRVQLFGEDVDNLVVKTKRAGVVRARLAFEGTAPPAEAVEIRPAFVGPRCGLIALSTSCSGGSIGLVQTVTPDDWTFDAQLTGLGVLRLQRPANWFLKAVVLDGKDITDTPVEFATAFDGKPAEIVLTQRRARVTGVVSDARGQTVGDATVVLFPEDAQQWTEYSRFIATSRPDQEGRFELAGLPPGRYLIAALEYLPPGDARNPETLAGLRPGAVSFSLSDGESRSISLRIAP